ncbi:M4 family metallopeptidase [Nonomuraea sp. NPDC050556]|uniref:M4 family metallopeptidase n=1 Tax=Nonomuraea sp. NPDC050556 TaxID=3364369 RepID=UPI0037884482
MNPRLKLGAAALLALVLTTTGATSAVAQTDPPTPQEHRNAVSAAVGALAANSQSLLTADQDQYTLTNSVGGPRGLQFLTYARTHAGLPVYGGDVVVATDESGSVVQNITTGQQAKLQVDTKATVSSAAATAVAKAQLARVDTAAAPTLVVHAATAKPRLAWEVLVTGASAHGPSVLHVFVDAKTAKVIDTADEVREGTGNSFYNGNPVTIDTTPSYSMRDSTRPGIQCGGQDGQVYTGPDDNWGNGSGTNLETACVDALFAVQKEWNMLREWLNRNGINGSGSGFPIRVGLADVNAYWNGSYTSFGHNQANNQQATPMDVVGHEFGHAIFQTSGSGGSGSGNETGGLNESTGDIFGALTEAYANEPANLDPPDYLVGEEVNLVGQGPIRNMYNPSALGHPNCYTGSFPEVHAGAGPQNHWFYLVAEGTNPSGKPASTRCDNGAAITGIGIQKAGQVFQTALNMKTIPWTHGKARLTTLQAAKQLFPGSCVEFNVVKNAWNGVSVPAQANEPTCQSTGNDFTVALDPATGTVQPGGSATSTVRTTVTSGNAQSVSLRTTGTLPAGVTATFSPPTIQSGQTSTLTLSTTSATPNGNHTINVLADGADVDKQTAFSLTVGTVADDYSISVNPSSATVQAGGSTSATVGTQVTSGQAQQVALSATGQPAGVTVTFSPQTITAGQSSTVSIATTASVAAGQYPISINGDGTSADHATTFTLTVGSDQGTTWKPWTAYATGAVVTYQGVSYRCRQGHTSQPGWEPPNVLALWLPI